MLPDSIKAIAFEVAIAGKVMTHIEPGNNVSLANLVGHGQRLTSTA